MITGNYEKFCKKYELCEGYEKALNSSEKYFLHHIQGENISREELIEKDLYYDCEPSLLRWVTRTEHNKIHMTGENHPLFGKTHSDEAREKMSESSKGGTPWNKGKIQVYSDEARRKMSVAKKGKKRKPFTDETRRKIAAVRKGMSWKLVDGKRIWYKK